MVHVLSFRFSPFSTIPLYTRQRIASLHITRGISGQSPLKRRKRLRSRICRRLLPAIIEEIMRPQNRSNGIVKGRLSFVVYNESTFLVPEPPPIAK